MSNDLALLTVHLLVQDARVLAAMPPSDRPLDGEIAVPTDIAVTEAHAADIAGLTVGEGTAWVVDHLTDTVLAVVREDDDDLLAGTCPEFTEQRRARLRA